MINMFDKEIFEMAIYYSSFSPSFVENPSPSGVVYDVKLYLNTARVTLHSWVCQLKYSLHLFALSKVHTGLHCTHGCAT